MFPSLARKYLLSLALLPLALAIVAGSFVASGTAQGASSQPYYSAPARLLVPLDTPTPTATPSPTDTPVCQVQRPSTDVPKSIPDGQSGGVNSTLVITNITTISDVDLVGLNINHGFIHDIRVRLTSPQGTQVLLIN